MTKLKGTHVIAKIVTPDDKDTFATHDANLCEGGLHQVPSIKEMQNITTERRKAGTECRVYADSTPENNGKYILQNDLKTWKKEVVNTALGNPPDKGWGKGSATSHALTLVATGDSIENRWDKLLTYLDNIAPELPLSLKDTRLILQNTWTGNKQGEKEHVPLKNIQANVLPTATLDKPFGDTKAGMVKAYINNQVVGTYTLTDQGAGKDDGVYQQLILSNEAPFNKVYQHILAAIKPIVPLALNNIQHTYKLSHGGGSGSGSGNSTTTTFYVDDPVQPIVEDTILIGRNKQGAVFISGVPTLKADDGLLVSFTCSNVVSWFYNTLKIADISSSFSTAVTPPVPKGLNRGIGVRFDNIETKVISGVYTENATVKVTAYNSRALSNPQKPTDSTSKTVTKGGGGSGGGGAGSGNVIRIDTISDESFTRSSGQGQYAVVGPGGAGETFNRSEDLGTTGNEELMMLGGIVQFPTGDYSNNTPISGPDYSAIKGGSYKGYRWRTVDLGVITAQNAVVFHLITPTGFNGSPIESGNYALYLMVEKATGWLNANAPYPGVGNPIKNGDPALDIAQSTRLKKRVTFGTAPRSGRVLVRIGWAKNEKRTFKRIQ